MTQEERNTKAILEEIARRDKEKKAAMEQKKKDMGNRLKDTVFKTGMTQAEFSEICDVGLETIKKYMSGKHFIRVDNLVTFANQLEVPLEYLLCIEKKETSLEEKIKKATNLSDDAISTLFAIKNDPEYVECINVILKNKKILQKLVKYFRFLNHIETIKFPSGFDYFEVDNIYLYQTMKEIEKAVKRDTDMKKGGK